MGGHTTSDTSVQFFSQLVAKVYLSSVPPDEQQRPALLSVQSQSSFPLVGRIFIGHFDVGEVVSERCVLQGGSVVRPVLVPDTFSSLLDGHWKSNSSGMRFSPGSARLCSSALMRLHFAGRSSSPRWGLRTMPSHFLRFSSASLTSGMALFDQLLVVGILAVVLVGGAE
uniref:Uncharacterized protein n=1 Tax=Chromera velia CCMP2878 TaxID=1169474 RepID=A0A0K6S970_9ALVE|eukprot:Cvel_28675.t1-p1 / transcript=Cvel_28675.t1 / gene=Cvel_28675 / organism=Chromera_velia_CCMP2878 / gene_product=hypothetical protein / transcript_product=hypothetical protein / location=Cvel_scaffold3801:2432-6241(-) / protein_length=168 / sequence_SO=supercontig / SO=protein_coding / is_pseudo=false